jgi:hypothetical protein
LPRPFVLENKNTLLLHKMNFCRQYDAFGQRPCGYLIAIH